MFEEHLSSTSAAGAYSETDAVAALRAAGVSDGDLLFVHANLEALGEARECGSDPQRAAMMLRALRLVLGDTGTLVIPAYTFSFCRQLPFDRERSATEGGPWSPSAAFLEEVRHQPDAVRSCDPIHSVVALGPAAHALLDGLPSTCFGPDSLQHRLRIAGGKICAIGLGLHELTMVHHAEVMMAVPFRYRKLFTGAITRGGETRRAGWVYDVRMPGRSSELNPARIAGARLESGLVRETAVGQGVLSIVDAQRFYDFLCARIAEDPWFTVKGPPLPRPSRYADPSSSLSSSSSSSSSSLADGESGRVALPVDASMETIVRTLWRLPRDIISDGYDEALAAIGTQLPMHVHEYPTGTQCFTWIVPERWTCHEAWLETLDGHRLFSYADHPLHVVSYSLPFEGIVSRDELLRHLHVHERLPDAIPFIFKYYERDWGLCCSRRLRDSLRDTHYKVVIRTTADYGALKVGECVLPGETDESIVLCAHLCHPAMAVDDLTGVAVGVDVMRALRRRQEPLRYTYRLLILPETIGSVAWLSDHAALIKRLKGGLFLEMLGLDHPHALQRSFASDTEVDACFVAALRARDPYAWTAPYRDLVGNDERQFNAPGVRVPMLQLLRVLPPSHADYPYHEYHSSLDTPDVVAWRRLDESRDLVLQMIDTLERNRVPINRFSGEVCCSRHGLHIDWWENPDGHRALFRIMDLIDGTRSIVEIAQICGTSPDVVDGVLDELDKRGLVGWREAGPAPETRRPDAP